MSDPPRVLSSRTVVGYCRFARRARRGQVIDTPPGPHAAQEGCLRMAMRTPVGRRHRPGGGSTPRPQLPAKNLSACLGTRYSPIGGLCSPVTSPVLTSRPTVPRRPGGRPCTVPTKRRPLRRRLRRCSAVCVVSANTFWPVWATFPYGNATTRRRAGDRVTPPPRPPPRTSEGCHTAVGTVPLGAPPAYHHYDVGRQIGGIS